MLIASLALAACSSDDESGGGDDGGGTIESLLDEIPASANTEPANIMIVAGDVDRAAEAAGVTPYDADTTTDEMLDTITLLTGISRNDEPAKVHIVLPEAVSPNYLNLNDEIHDELGWSIVDVNTFIEIQNPPNQFTVMRADVTADEIDDAAGEAEDGIWSLGGEDLEVDPANRTAARELGESLRMALDDDLLAVSRTTPPVRDWLDDDGETLADDEALVSIAQALDAADVYSSMIMVNDFSIVAALGSRGNPEQIEKFMTGTTLIEPFDALGAGLSVVDDEAVGMLVYHYPTEDAAESAVDSIRAVFEEGSSLVSNRAISDLFELSDVQADGDVVVASFGFGDALPGSIWSMVYTRDLPTAHG